MTPTTTSLDWESFERAAAGPACRALLSRDGRPYFLLTARQLDRADIAFVIAAATAARRLDRVPEGRAHLRGLLADRRVMNLFAQPSTRTCESFAAAAEKVGASVRVMNDVRTSSFSKGESVEDGVRMLATVHDALVVRHPDDRFALRAAWAMARSPWPMPVISAGSGTREHPTQALLDVYTLEEHLADRGGIDGKRLLMIGDLGRNRTARSLIALLGRFELAELALVCHPDHPPDGDLVAAVAARGTAVTPHRSVHDALSARPGAFDAIYVTRLQQEWDAAGAPLGTDPAFVLDPALRDLVRADCAILHPLPRVNELPTAWDDHPAFLVWRQMRNGLWIRAAVLAHVFGQAEGLVGRAAGLTDSGRT